MKKWLGSYNTVLNIRTFSFLWEEPFLSYMYFDPINVQLSKYRRQSFPRFFISVILWPSNWWINFIKFHTMGVKFYLFASSRNNQNTLGNQLCVESYIFAWKIQFFVRLRVRIHICTCCSKRTDTNFFSAWHSPFKSKPEADIFSTFKAGIFKKSMGARHRVGIGLSYRPARLHRLAEFINWNRFLGPINV